MKIYTRTGDTGETGLFSGERVPKSAPRVEAYGDVDELNTLLGLAGAHLTDPDLQKLLHQLQEELFTVGADLATPVTGKRRVDRAPRISADHVTHLEGLIDKFETELPPLANFILPGGAPAGACLHVARTVARRAERRVVALTSQGEAVDDHVLRYLNRMSDLLFVLARVANHRAGEPETPWQP